MIKILTSFFYVAIHSISITGLVIFIVWGWQPSLVENIDAYVKNGYTSYYQSKFNDAILILPAESEKLEYFVYVSMKSITKGDRVYHLKVKAVNRLGEYYLNNNNEKKALKAARLWVSLDRHDYHAKIFLIKAKSKVKKLGEEAIEEAILLHEKFPESVTITKAVTSLLEDKKRYIDAVSVLIEHLRTRGRWSDKINNDNFNLQTINSASKIERVDLSSQLLTDSNLEFSFFIKNDSTSLQMNFPALFMMRIEEIYIKGLDYSSSDLTGGYLGMAYMKRNERSDLEPSGTDFGPILQIPIPKELIKTTSIVTLMLKVSDTLPTKIKEISQKVDNEFIANLKENVRLEKAEMLRFIEKINNNGITYSELL